MEETNNESETPEDVEAEEVTTPEETEQEKTQQEAEDYKHKYLHLLADYENSRKRLQKDRDEIIQYSIRSILLDFLHPIDHMENALKYAEESSDEVRHWAKGFEMILDQFKEVLANNGVKPIEAIGKEFDPHFHDAVEMVETEEHPPGIVVEESVKGYKISDKTLRPSRVKVSKAPAADKDNLEQKTSEKAEQEQNS